MVHGPVPRSHAHSLPKRVRRLGLQCALSAKAWERRLLIVDSLRPAEPRTKAMQAHVAALLAGAPRQSVLLCDSSKQGEDGGDELRRGAANLPWVDCIPQLGLNVYSILQVGAGGGRAAGGGGSFTGVLRTAHDHSAPPARPDSPLSSPPSQRDYLVLSRRAADLLAERLRRPIKPCSPTP